MNFTTLLLACLLSGVAFAALAAWLTTRKGNTISDVANSQHLEGAEAIKIEIMDKVKLSSNIPIVGLYVVAAAVAVGLPAFVYRAAYSESSTVVFLSGSVEGPVPSGSSNVFLRSTDTMVNPETRFFSVPIAFTTGQPLVLTLQGPDYHPVGMSVVLDRLADTLKVQFQGREDNVPLQDHRAILSKPISLTLISETHEAPPNQPSAQPPVPAALAAAAPPSGGGQ
jgi:hypothetical protein